MIKPTIGRVVLYYPKGDYPANDHIRPVPALVCRVWSDRLINIGGFDINGSPFGASSVILQQEGDPLPPGSYAAWMPYQIQAAKKQEINADASVAAREEQSRP